MNRVGRRLKADNHVQQLHRLQSVYYLDVFMESNMIYLLQLFHLVP